MHCYPLQLLGQNKNVNRAMSEKRGSKLLKLIDRYIGSALLLALAIALNTKRVIYHIAKKEPSSDRQYLNTKNYLLVCFGAIGDLILLTQAAKTQLNGKKVFLACTSSNKACAELYKDFYAGIEIIDIRLPSSLLKVCKKYQIQVVFDSTQWANIGPILTAVAQLCSDSLETIGFHTSSRLRNGAYNYTIEHSNQLHEIANFINLLSPQPCILTNTDIQQWDPGLYKRNAVKKTKKILFHLWPSGSRSYLKEWPKSYWVQLAQNLISEGYAIYLSGSPTDKIRNEELILESGLPLINIAGKYSLSELRDFIMQNIDFAICVNTGILHLSASLGIPVIGLHGPTNPNRWGPLGSQSISLLPTSGLSSYLNYGFEYPKDDDIAYSLDKLSVSQVIEAIKNLADSLDLAVPSDRQLI